MRIAIIVIILILIFGGVWWAEHFDPCPKIYQGQDCKGKTCNHSNREWALLGIDKDELHGQPHPSLYKEDRDGPL